MDWTVDFNHLTGQLDVQPSFMLRGLSADLTWLRDKLTADFDEEAD